MKTLFLTALITLSLSSAFAAKFVDIGQPTAKSLRSAVQPYDEMAEILGHQDYGPALSHVVSYNDDRDLGKIIRHYVWQAYTDWSRPDDVVTDPVERSFKSYKNEVEDFVFWAEDAEVDDLILDFQKRVEKLAKYKTMKMFELSHGNSFGGCHGFAVVDTFHKEFVLFQSCYAE